ncbi:hypothetical protein [Rhodococcus ruber]|uniref:hypothetical protein n=1 Tax=Rhodococcus ruber TaxID=1830 RepID=UPI001F3C0B01|nr:hypothetical protein [Rhodococcus ruber]
MERAWMQPLAELGAGTVTALVPDTLVDLLGRGLALRYAGRPVETTVQGAPLRAVVDGVRIRRDRAHLRASVRLSRLDWDDRRIDSLTVTAHGLRIVPGLSTRISAARLDVQGVAPITVVLDWFNSLDTPWRLSRGDDIRADHRRLNVSAVVDGAVVDDVAYVELLRLRCYGLLVPVVAARRVPLPPLPAGIRKVYAARLGDDVRFGFEIADVDGVLPFGDRPRR